MTERERVYLICVLVLLSSSQGPWWWRVLSAQVDPRIIESLLKNRES